MTSSREQFEEWFPSMVEGMPENMRHVFDEMLFMAWQASRQCIEVELPFYCEGYQHDKAIIDSLRAAGIKIKGA